MRFSIDIGTRRKIPTFQRVLLLPRLERYLTNIARRSPLAATEIEKSATGCADRSQQELF